MGFSTSRAITYVILILSQLSRVDQLSKELPKSQGQQVSSSNNESQVINSLKQNLYHPSLKLFNKLLIEYFTSIHILL